MDRRLRIGVLVDSCSVPSWACAMLDRIRAGDYGEIVVFISDEVPTPPRTGFLYRAFLAMERILFPVSPDALAPEGIRERFPQVPVLPVSPRDAGADLVVTAQDLARIGSFNLDVLVGLGSRPPVEGLLRSARCGVWSYVHGDDRRIRGGPPGFWEVMLGWAETGTTLRILTEAPETGQVLSRSHSKTDYLSVRRSMNVCFWKAASMVPRKLEELHRVGEEAFLARIALENADPAFFSGRRHGSPSNGEMAWALLRSGLRHVFTKAGNLVFLDQWCLMYALTGSGDPFPPVGTFRELVPPKDRFWADPFLVFRGGKHFLFFEELPFSTEKGHLCCIPMDEAGNPGEPRKVLERPYHLSYPFIFDFQGLTYMVPETACNRTIELYRCLDFPDRWELDRVLMKDIHAVDTTLHQADGLWWMFVNIQEQEGASSCDELFIYSAPSPLSQEWTPHPANPVVSDVRSSRPAGRIFRRGDAWYRPSQDCSQEYGYAIRINRIETLTPTEYRETCIGGIEPDWDPAAKAVHTLNSEAGMTVLDAVKRRWRFLG